MVIHKYELKIEDEFQVEVRHNLTPLRVDIQDDTIYLWAEVSESPNTVSKTFYCRGTGGITPVLKTYLGTVQKDGYVWHFFMEGMAL